MAKGIATVLSHGGRCADQSPAFVNPPVWRGSTVLFPDLASLIGHTQAYSYGRHGTPATRALTSLLKTLDGPNTHWTAVTPSGLSAIALAIMSVAQPGGHILVADSVYGGTRSFCDGVLARMNVEVTYFDPSIGAGIADLMRPSTFAVFVETPGSQTFEMMDIPAIAEVAHAGGAVVLADNTWATPLHFRALDFGVDISIQSATKYIIGHSDALMGVISANERTWQSAATLYRQFGYNVGPDDVALALRGLRTLKLRLKDHERSALEIAAWLETRAEVARVLHPGLPSHPGHALWQRDFDGASGAFGVVLKPTSFAAVEAMFNGLELFGMGYSFGGYESLISYVETAKLRSATPWSEAGTLIRLQIGLETTEDLIADLSAGLARLSGAEGSGVL